MKKMVKEKDMPNKKQNLPCRSWCHVQLLFLHLVLRFALLLLLHHSVKLAIPHYHLFLLFQIVHLVLFKSLQLQGDLSISKDSRVVFWWARYGNRRLSFLSRYDLPFVRNGFLRYIFDLFLTVSFEQLSSWCCRNMARIAMLLMSVQQLLRYWAVPLTA